MGLDDDIAILAAAPVFGHLDRDALRLLSFAAERRELGDGDLLFARGDPADGGFVVLSGTIRLEPRSGAPVRAGRSAVIGHLALFVRGERVADARAEGGCELIRITPTLMRRVLEEFPDAAQAIHEALSRDLMGFTGDLDRIRALLGAPAAGDSPGERL